MITVEPPPLHCRTISEIRYVDYTERDRSTNIVLELSMNDIITTPVYVVEHNEVASKEYGSCHGAQRQGEQNVSSITDH